MSTGLCDLPPTPYPYPHPIPHPTPMHYSDVIMCAMASQITSFAMVCSTIYSGADQRKHQSCASLAFVRGIHRGPVNFITATSRHDCTIPNQTFLFISLNSAISVRLWPWCHGGYSGCLLKWTIGAELKTENLKGFQRLPILDHCAVTTARGAWNHIYLETNIYWPYYWSKILSKVYIFTFYRLWSPYSLHIASLITAMFSIAGYIFFQRTSLIFCRDNSLRRISLLF